MYTWEIKSIIEENNGVITSRKVLLSLIDIHKNPQFNNIRYYAGNSTYTMIDDTNTEIKFKAKIFDIIEDALIIINPEGMIFSVKDSEQDRHKYLFEKVENEEVQELTRNETFGCFKAQRLGQNGYTVLIGSKASSKQGKEYYSKKLSLPFEWKTEEAEILYRHLLKAFENAPSDIIVNGLELEIRIYMPDGQYFEIYYPNEVFKNNSFNAEKEAERIKKMQEELKQGNSKAVDQISR